MYDYAAARNDPQPAASAEPPTASDGAPTAAVIAAYKEEVQALRDTVEALSHSSANGSGDGLLEGRYLAQIHKNKTLTVQLETQRNRAKQLQEKLDVAVRQAADVVAASSGAGAAGKEKEKEKDSTGEKLSLKDRLDNAYAQVRERDVQLSEVRRESGLLRTALGRELGKSPEELTAWLAQQKSIPSDAGGEGGGWRGRAERIALLQAKVKDLQRALATGATDSSAADRDEESIGSAGSCTPTAAAATATAAVSAAERAALIAEGGDDLASLMRLAQLTSPQPDASAAGSASDVPAVPRRSKKGNVAPSVVSRGSALSGTTAATTLASKRDVDDDARDALSALANGRLQAQRELAAQLARSEEAVKEEKANKAGLQARLVSLQRDNAQLRGHVQVILDKSRSDDELVAAYKAELAELQSALTAANGQVKELLQEEAAQRSYQQKHNASTRHGTDRESSDGAALAAARSENARLVSRVESLERIVAHQHAPSQSAGPETGEAAEGRPPASTPAGPASYRESVVRWALEAAAATDQHTGATPSSVDVPTALPALLHAAHAHILIAERRLQQVESERETLLSSSTAAAAALPRALLAEKVGLQERVKSLAELLRREAEVQRQAIRHSSP